MGQERQQKERLNWRRYTIWNSFKPLFIWGLKVRSCILNIEQFIETLIYLSLFMINFKLFYTWIKIVIIPKIMMMDQSKKIWKTSNPIILTSLSLPAPNISLTLSPFGMKNPLAIPKLAKTLNSPCLILISELPNIRKYVS